MQHRNSQTENSDCKKLLELVGGKSIPGALYNIGVGPSEEEHNEAVFFKQMFPDIEIFGVEANPKFALSRSKNYPGSILSKGVWSEKCVKTLSVPLSGTGRSSLLNAREEWAKKKSFNVAETIDVECTTLDAFDVIAGKPDRIWLWMDIEGAELEALKGAKNLLQSRRVDVITLEVSTKGIGGIQLARRHGEPSIVEIENYLNGFDYVGADVISRASIFVNVLFLRKELLQ